MNLASSTSTTNKLYIHPWLKNIHISFVPGPTVTPLAEDVIENILKNFRLLGHTVQEMPNDDTNIILTTAPFGEPLSWRKAIALTGRMRFGYKHSPTIYTMVHIKSEELHQTLDYFENVLSKSDLDPEDYEFPGLAPGAYKVLYEQGNRGGPILALERLVQAQAKNIRILLLVGDETPLKVYHFDLVGAYPQSDASDTNTFYEDIVLRMVTSVSTHEITEHQVVGEIIPRSTWDALDTPAAMRAAAQELGELNFFTEMVIIDHIVQIPAVTDAVASQYSEGCFATWDPQLSALITTITGSARPVDKSSLSDDDLAVIVGVRPDRKGALIRNVEGKRNDPPSSEAVELVDLDSPLPHIELPPEWGISATVPAARSKLHGHRGISSYNPNLVEFVPLDPPYYSYPVTCATEAQATGIKGAFSRSEALRNPLDPRSVVFTVLPTHGVVIAEKWVHGKAPFQVIWEYMQSGDLVVDNRISQGDHEYTEQSGHSVLKNM